MNLQSFIALLNYKILTFSQNLKLATKDKYYKFKIISKIKILKIK